MGPAASRWVQAQKEGGGGCAGWRAAAWCIHVGVGGQARRMGCEGQACFAPLRERQRAHPCVCKPCPRACACLQPDDGGGGEQDQAACHVGAMSCWDFLLLWVWLGGQAALALCFSPPGSVRALAARVAQAVKRAVPGGAVPGGSGAGGSQQEDSGAGLRARLLPCSCACCATHAAKSTDASFASWGADAPPPAPAPPTHVPWVEAQLRDLFHKLVRALRPMPHCAGAG